MPETQAMLGITKVTPRGAQPQGAQGMAEILGAATILGALWESARLDTEQTICFQESLAVLSHEITTPEESHSPHTLVKAMQDFHLLWDEGLPQVS